MLLLKRSWHLIVAAILIGFLYGLEFQSSFSNLPEGPPWQGVLLWSCVPIGASVGCLLLAKVAEWIGTVCVFQLSALFWAGGAIMSIFVGNIWLVMAARGLVGLGAGSMMAAVLVYTAQMVKSKGFVLSVAYASGVGGIMAGTALLKAFEGIMPGKWPFHSMLIIQAAWAILLFFMAFFVPEYPPWLQWRGFHDKSNEIQHALSRRVFSDSGSCCSLKVLFRRHGRALLRAEATVVAVVLTGISNLMLCVPELLFHCQVPSEQIEKYVYVLYGMMVVFSLVFSFLAQYAAKKDSIIFGSACLSGAYIAIFSLMKIFGQNAQNGMVVSFETSGNVNSALVALYIYALVVYASTIKVASILYAMECFEPEARTKGIFLVIATAWILDRGVGVALPLLLRAAQEWTFLVLGILSLLGTVMVAFFPEANEAQKITVSDEEELVSLSSKVASPENASSATAVESSSVSQSYTTPQLFGHRRGRKSPKRLSMIKTRTPNSQKAVSRPLGPVRALPLLSPGTRFQTAENESLKSENSAESQATVILRTAKAHQSVQTPELGSHLDGLWSDSEVGYGRSQNTAYKRGITKLGDSFRVRNKKPRPASAASGFHIAEQPAGLFGRPKSPSRSGLLNANIGT